MTLRIRRDLLLHLRRDTTPYLKDGHCNKTVGENIIAGYDCNSRITHRGGWNNHSMNFSAYSREVSVCFFSHS